MRVTKRRASKAMLTTASSQALGDELVIDDDVSGTVGIWNPAASDGRSAFRPITGRTYFKGLG